MFKVLIRTVAVYVLLIATMRLMGKRQLGEIEVSELVTTLLISEIATLPIGDPELPLIHAVIPLVTILALEVFLSVILLKCPKLKNLASTRPSVLIRHGELDQTEMERVRISIDELISEVRQAGLSSLEEVDYAILEQNGKLTVIPKKSVQPVTPKDLGLHVSENGISHVLIEDGVINRYNLKRLKRDEQWLTDRLRERALSARDVFFLGMDDGGTLYWIEREDLK
jgi:uncharacterized membrane protein YcaP (DUF421 family)